MSRCYRDDCRRWFGRGGAAREALAFRLGVTASSLARLAVGYTRDLPGRPPCWTWPMWRPAIGSPSVSGVRLRRDLADGQRHHDSIPGGHDGLHLDVSLVRLLDAGAVREPPSLLVLAEGPSDGAALLDVMGEVPGVVVAALPSCGQGLGHLRLLIEALAPGRVLALGDRDDPGRRGAERAAEAVAGCGTAARTGYPPDGLKDARDWLGAGLTAPDLLRLAGLDGTRDATGGSR